MFCESKIAAYEIYFTINCLVWWTCELVQLLTYTLDYILFGIEYRNQIPYCL